MPSVQEILLEQARQAGQTGRERGAIIGDTITGLSRVPGQILADRQAQHVAAITLAQKLADQRAQEEDRIAQAEQRRQQAARDTARLGIEQQNATGMAADRAAKSDADHRQMLADFAEQMQRANYSPDLMQTAIQNGKGIIWRTPEEQTQLADALKNPDTIKPFVDGLATLAKPKAEKAPIKLSEGDVLVPPTGGPPLATNPKLIEPKPITFGQPQPLMVGGKRRVVRAGSDGKLYDVNSNQPVVGDIAPDVAPKDPLAQEMAAQRLADAKDKAAARDVPFDITPDARTTQSGRKFLDLSLYQGEQRNKAREAAAKAGIVPVGKESADGLREIDNARLNQKAILEQVTPLLPKDPTGRIIGAATRKMSQVMQTDAQRGAFNSWRTAAINTLRATAGSKGLRINQAEIAQAIENDIPTLNDTVDVAMQKVKNITTMLDNAETATLGSSVAGTAPKKIGRFDVEVH